MNDTYIKLFRKLKDHDIMRDPTAFHIFIWILISVDYKTGTMISGRFWASSLLGVNPNTYYKALKRLEKKYDLVTLSGNNKNTKILVNKWKKYQSDDTTTGNNKVTTGEQQSNTNQEIKEIRKREAQPRGIARSLKDELDEKTVSDIAHRLRVKHQTVEDTKAAYIDWIQSKPNDKKRQGRSMKATVQAWLRRDLSSGKIKQTLTFDEKLAKYAKENL